MVAKPPPASSLFERFRVMVMLVVHGGSRQWIVVRKLRCGAWWWFLLLPDLPGFPSTTAIVFSCCHRQPFPSLRGANLRLMFPQYVQKEAMKESPKRYTNPFLSDEENEKLNLWNQELEHSNPKNDLTNNPEDDKLINSLAASEFCEKEAELYTIKNVTECELPESLLCYKEVPFIVKDICVDEGIPQGEKILFDEKNNAMLKPELLKFSTMEDCFMESNLCSEDNGKINTSSSVLEPSNEHMKIRYNLDEVIESKSDSGNNDGVSSQSDTIPKAIDNNGPEISLQPDEEHINSSSVPSLQQDRPLPSLKSLLESIDQQPSQSPEEKISERPVENKSTPEGNTTLNLNNTEPTTSNGVHSNENPGLVTYSGPMAFNGSTSLRSDSSTTSTRSFAFPILQSEWNSSPVRMAKADRRRLPKQRGWRHGLLCCRF